MVNTFTIATDGFSNAPIAYGAALTGQAPRSGGAPPVVTYSILREDGSGVIQLESGAGVIELESGP